MGDLERVQVLLAISEERSRALHLMRERVQKTCLWLMGTFLGVAGWIIKGNLALTIVQKSFLVGVIVVAVSAVIGLFLEDIRKGFGAQQRVLARAEQALGLYEPGVYDTQKTGLFPSAWGQAGTQNGCGKFFRSSYVMLLIGASVLIVTLISQGHFY